MDSPQYLKTISLDEARNILGFKPYYKWIVLNTQRKRIEARITRNLMF